MPLDLSTCLKFYKRKEIQEAIIEHASKKEIGVRYNEAFGKRPDILIYPKEILEFALKNATSFHASEELWENPLELKPNLTKKELEEMRRGWDLVLDVDCPDWEFSKLTAYLFIKSLRDNQVQEISCKYSGNKGFHIGVPFEAFPQEIAGKKTKDLFPLAPQKITQYLLNYISNNYILIQEDRIIFDEKYFFSLGQLKEKFGEKEFILSSCQRCHQKINFQKDSNSEFICPKCEIKIKSEAEFLLCEKCHHHMVKMERRSSLCSCGSDEYVTRFNPFSIIEADTILISSRHLYRMPFSLHEKSGLVSLPIDPENVMAFEREAARPENVFLPKFKFLERHVPGGSARWLLMNALDFEVKRQEELKEKKERKGLSVNPDLEEVKVGCPIKEDFFPPCFKLMSEGLEDGKKRAVFCWSNFLGKLGWGSREIEEYLLKWNQEKNKIPLRENYILGQLRYHKAEGKLPPNCDNEAYYLDLGVCKKDFLCQRIKNPVNYTLLKWKMYQQEREEAEKEEAKEQKKKEKEMKKLEKEAKKLEPKTKKRGKEQLMKEEKSQSEITAVRLPDPELGL